MIKSTDRFTKPEPEAFPGFHANLTGALVQIESDNYIWQPYIPVPIDPSAQALSRLQLCDTALQAPDCWYHNF